MEQQHNDKCAFDKWVDALSVFLKSERRGSNIVVLVHTSPGGVEAIYSNQDPVIAEGMLKIATVALDIQVTSTMSNTIQKSANTHPEAIFNDKLKVN